MTRYRDLKCTQCNLPSGFTLANLDKVMVKSYVMHYHCNHCNTYTVHAFIGEPYDRDRSGKRIQPVLEFEEAS